MTSMSFFLKPSFKFLFLKVITVNNFFWPILKYLLHTCVTQWYAGKHRTTSSLCPCVFNSQVIMKVLLLFMVIGPMSKKQAQSRI